ncbi:hypothetical protein BH09MYX1_BH09MYX1_30930 [soil metagenome]
MRGRIAIALILAASLGVACAKRSDSTMQAQNMGCTMRSAADVAYITDGTCPTPAKLVSDKRLTESVVDPWGHDFVIACDDEIRVRSLGPDGKAKTPDDVVYDAHACNVLH